MSASFGARDPAQSGGPDLDTIGRVLDLMPDGVIAVGTNGRIAYANPAAHRLFGYDAGDLVGRPLNVLVPEPLRRAHDGYLARAARSGVERAMGERPVLSGVTRNGEEIPVSIALGEFEADGERLHLAVVRDQSALADALDRARVEAETDPLTGIGNRRHLETRLHRLARSGRPFALLYLDLDRFKQLNDRHGHALGDSVLRTIARRLQAGVRKADTCVRMGGDEFVVLAPGIADHETLRAMASKVGAHLVEPLDVGETRVTVGVSIGALACTGEASEADLMAAADAAMYEAKRKRGSPRVHVTSA